MTEHKMILEANDGTNWNEITSYKCDSRYELSRDQREELNRLKYECELAKIEWRIVKERRMSK